MPTSRITSAERAAMAVFDDIPCARSASANCAPTDVTGLSAFIALCITTDRCCQRTGASCLSVIATRFLPSNVMDPAVRWAGGTSRCAIANSKVDLPQPDSPTIARNSPRSTLSDTSSTARTGSPPVAYSTVRPDTSSTAEPPQPVGPLAPSAYRAQRGVADLVERVVEQGEGRAEQGDAGAGDHRLQVFAYLQCLVILRPVEHGSPGDRVRIPEADELQAGGEE